MKPAPQDPMTLRIEVKLFIANPTSNILPEKAVIYHDGGADLNLADIVYYAVSALDCFIEAASSNSHDEFGRQIG